MTPWLLALMIAVLPPDRHPREAPADVLVRYQAIAETVAETVERNGPLVGKSHARSAVLMLAVAYLESGWRVDVDTGATRGKAGECSLW